MYSGEKDCGTGYYAPDKGWVIAKSEEGIN
jgi:hypothetical protein